jgi:hypothetical protein
MKEKGRKRENQEVTCRKRCEKAKRKTSKKLYVTKFVKTDVMKAELGVGRMNYGGTKISVRLKIQENSRFVQLILVHEDVVFSY